MAEPDAAGPRGTLYAFDRALARASVDDAPPVDDATCEAVRDGYRTHLAAYERVFGDVVPGGAIVPGGRQP